MFLFFSGGQKIYFEGARLDVIQNPGIIFKYRPTNSEFVVVSLLLLAKNIKKNVDASCAHLLHTPDVLRRQRERLPW